MLNQMRAKRFKQVLQTVTYMPHFISVVVVVSMLTIFLSPSNGLYGNIMRALGLEAENIMGDAGMFRSIYVWSDVWQHTGWDSIIYLAALSGVDPNLYEAATVDGASRFKKMIHIDIPSLAPTCIVLLILRIGGVMNVGFDKAFLMQNPLNTSSSEIISTYVYKVGLVSGQFSMSAAVGLFNNAINFILLVVVNKISRRVSDSSLW
jgi:putative aldouronate transport system permease protein